MDISCFRSVSWQHATATPTTPSAATERSFRIVVCRDPTPSNVLEQIHPSNEVPMLYAILAYHEEANVLSWTAEEDATVMTDLHRVHDKLNQDGRLGPAARMGATGKARTPRGPAAGLVNHGAFAAS